MKIISNASISMMDEAIRHIYEEGGSCEYNDLKKIIDRDPHHQVNNGIRLGLLVKKDNMVFITELGKKYKENNYEKRIEILREQAFNIRILELCIKRLRVKKELRRTRIGEIWGELTGKEYSQETLNRNISLVVKWMVELGYGEKSKDKNLRWKEN